MLDPTLDPLTLLNQLPLLAASRMNATVNGVIATGCLACALALTWLNLKRRDLRFRALFVLFALMFLAGALAALSGTGLVWLPKGSGMILKWFAGLMAWAAAFALVRALPTLLTAPGFAQIREELAGAVAGRRKAEEQIERLNVDLQHRVQELQALLDVLPVGIGIATDPRCENIRTNRAFAEILRLAPQANASLTAMRKEAPTHFKVLSEGRELAPHELPIQRAAATGQVVPGIEEEIVFSDGRRAHLLGYAAPLHDASNTVRGAVGAFVDITERKRAEEERLRVEHKLQESQKLESLGVLAGGIAHDFNNLLTGVIGNASLARLDLPESSELHACIAEIEDAAQRAADLCKQMLAYAGRGRFVVENIDLNRVIQDTASLLQSSVSKSAALRLDLAAQAPVVQADATQLRQILMNLVINASEAIGAAPGTITVTTGTLAADRAYLETTAVGTDLPAGDYAFMEVRDTGCGMPPEILARIFDPFFTTKFTGRGLGLAATLGIVRGHGGAVRVESEVGRGTTFRVLFPSIREAAVTSAPKAATPKRWRAAGTVLVVDDEATIMGTATRMLESLGFRVIAAADGSAGVEILRTQRDAVTAILLDLTMPKMGGEEAFREIRKIRADVPVVLMSGFNEQEAVTPFHGKGLSGFLQKPFTFESLQECLSKVLPGN